MITEDELRSGIKAQLAIELYGEDLAVLRAKVEEIHSAVETGPGLVDLSSEQNFGQPQIQIVADREACARDGVFVDEILETIELTVGSEVIDSLSVNGRRFGIHLRFQKAYRSDPAAIGSIRITTSAVASKKMSHYRLATV